MPYKKKLYSCNPKKDKKEIEVFVTKRKKIKRAIDTTDIERDIREILARKVSGTLLGIWLLIPEHLRLGTWDLLKTWTADSGGIKTRLAMQMVHEAALCVTGIRESRSLNHQGFEIANGLPFIASDQEIHDLLDLHTIEEAKAIQINLALLRQSLGHYKGNLLAFDPHRIPTYSRRIMVKKKSHPRESSKPVLQTFFCVDAETGQPFSFIIGSSGKTAAKSSIELLQMLDYILPSKDHVDLLADTEHESQVLLDYIIDSDKYEILMPASRRKKVVELIQTLPYERHWPGYATAETDYKYEQSKNSFRLIGQRSGEKDYEYKPFLATGNSPSVELITEKFPERWTIEEFFNFEGAIGWNRASTLNLNIRYGKMTLALIAQAVTHQLKKKLSVPYKNWTAEHLANSVFRGIDGDLRVKDDTIIVTLYNAPKSINLKKHYENLPEKLEGEGIDPRVPWLFNYKVDFRFK